MFVAVRSHAFAEFEIETTARSNKSEADGQLLVQ